MRVVVEGWVVEVAVLHHHCIQNMMNWLLGQSLLNNMTFIYIYNIYISILYL